MMAFFYYFILRLYIEEKKFICEGKEMKWAVHPP